MGQSNVEMFKTDVVSQVGSRHAVINNFLVSTLKDKRVP
jgi:hypothetical protein